MQLDQHVRTSVRRTTLYIKKRFRRDYKRFLHLAFAFDDGAGLSVPKRRFVQTLNPPRHTRLKPTNEKTKKAKRLRSVTSFLLQENL